MYQTWGAAMRAARFHADLTGFRYQVKRADKHSPYGNWTISMVKDISRAWNQLRAKRYQKTWGVTLWS